ncbi:hypothetical protein JXO59_01450 [candidate division KSB1 bacterium]|nr:hypothetical protein [candidate division KSB1 bacterium]
MLNSQPRSAVAIFYLTFLLNGINYWRSMIRWIPRLWLPNNKDDCTRTSGCMSDSAVVA